MIKTTMSVVRLLVRAPLCGFSRQERSWSSREAGEELELAEWRMMMEAERRNVMKNYDSLLPGVFVRNDQLIEEDVWETRSKRHRHAKLKRNRRKGPRRTVITN